MQIGRLKIVAKRWPWHALAPHWSHAVATTPPGPKYGWGRVPGMGRFGGGWDWKLGVCIGGSTIMLELIWGFVEFSITKREVA